MKISALNSFQLNTNNVSHKAKSHSSGITDTFSANTYKTASIPHFLPIIHFKSNTFNKDLNGAQKGLGLNGLDPIPAKIPEEIEAKGYKYYGRVNLQDKDKNPASGHAFVSDESSSKAYKNGAVHVLITDEEFDDIGYVIAHKCDRYVSVAINNYANVYKEVRCDYDSPIKKYHYSKNRHGKEDELYRKVGTELYRVLEEYLKEHHPEFSCMEACPVRGGSLEFHKKMGFRYSHTETYETYNGWDNPDVSFDYYIKPLR